MTDGRRVERGENRRWGAEQRLEFIELRAFWDGSLNRADIRAQFGVSAPQASADIATYLDLAPGNLVYDGSKKRYVAAADFAPRLVRPSAEAYLGELVERTCAPEARATWFGFVPNFATTPIPGRSVDVDVLRKVVIATREQMSIEILYQSMSPNRPLPQHRRITPHALASDRLRWHVRAFCHEAGSFKDFILSRVREVGSPGAAGTAGIRDEDWNTEVGVTLIPNPDLSPDQQRAVDWDYAMGGEGRLELTVRRALLYYLRQRLRLDVPSDRPAERPIVLENATEFEAAINLAKGAAG